MESDSKEETEHEASHQFLKVKFRFVLGQIGQKASKDIERLVKGLRNVGFKVPLAERSRRRLALELPFFPIDNENPGPMEWSKSIPDKASAYIVLAVVLLNVFEVNGVVDYMHAKERDCHLVGRPIPLVKREPGCTASGTIGLELLRISFESLPLWPGDPFQVGGG